MEFYNDELDLDETPFVTTLSRKELVNSRARLRSQINRDYEASNKRAYSMARTMLQQTTMVRDAETERSHALAYGVSSLSAKVLASLDIKAPVFLKQFRGSVGVANARTDFKSITLSVNTASFDLEDRNRVIDLIHMVKGLVYHEGGHLLWTLPFGKLHEQSTQGDLIGFGKYADKYITPESNVDRSLRSNNYMLQSAWNILEDQRMETAMCFTSPVMAKYFTNIVLNIVVGNNPAMAWPYIAGRTYLPKEIRQHLRDLAETTPHANMIDDINGIIMAYRKATDVDEMLALVRDFAECMVVWTDGASITNGVDNHVYENGFDGNDNGYGKIVELPAIPTPAEHDMEQPSKGITISDPNEEGEHTGESSSNGGASAGTKPLDRAPVKPIETSETVDEQPEQPNPVNKLKDLINKIKEELRESATNSEVTAFVGQVNDSINTPVKPDLTVMPMSDELVKQTDEVANGMRNVLEQLVVQNDPNWVHYQEDGVLDPTAFMLKQPGDTEYWSNLDGVGANGHDLAVSLVIDTSGSMGSQTKNVSVAAIGIRKACDALGIQCTVTTFNDDVYMVAKADEPIGYPCVQATGGTSVFNALAALHDQRYGRTYHLTVILTDGEWYDVDDIRPWSDPGRYFLLVGFNITKERLMNKGANQVVTVEELNELPGLVTNALAGYFL